MKRKKNDTILSNNKSAYSHETPHPRLHRWYRLRISGIHSYHPACLNGVHQVEHVAKKTVISKYTYHETHLKELEDIAGRAGINYRSGLGCYPQDHTRSSNGHTRCRRRGWSWCCQRSQRHGRWKRQLNTSHTRAFA